VDEDVKAEIRLLAKVAGIAFMLAAASFGLIVHFMWKGTFW